MTTALAASSPRGRSRARRERIADYVTKPVGDQLPYGKRRALNEMHSIFGAQWANGMLPQIRFTGEPGTYRPGPADWGVTPQVAGPTRLRTSGITQPPTMGLCLYEIFRKFSAEERVTHGADFLDLSHGLQRFHAWLLSERDPWGEHLVLCLHPWETGTDNSPAFESLNEAVRRYVAEQDLSVDLFGRADTAHVPQEHRPTDRDYLAYFGLLTLFKRLDYQQRAIIEVTPFLLQDVLFNGLLAASLRAQAELLTALADLAVEMAARGDQPSEREDLLAEAAQAQALYEGVAGAIRRKLWHAEDGIFYSVDARENRLLRTPTVSSFTPLLAAIASESQATDLVAWLTDPRRFSTPVPIPSTSAGSPAFDPLRYWSGPSWPVTNWLVLRGLRDRPGIGGPALAETIRQRTLRMIAEDQEAALVREAAIALLEANSVGEDFTTPSRQQYQHGWLWDSAIVAASWPLVADQPGRSAVPVDAPRPGFWEYYHPQTGAPLGARGMSWTASLYLELLHMDPAASPGIL